MRKTQPFPPAAESVVIPFSWPAWSTLLVSPLLYAMALMFVLSMMGAEGCVSSPENSSEVETGRNLFNGDGMCFGCHGKDADGHTGIEPIATQIKPNPPDLRDSRSLHYQKSEDIFRFLKERLHGPVSDEELLQIIAYLHTIRN